MNKLQKLKKLQNNLWFILSPSNDSESDKLRIERCNQFIADYINSEPSFETNILSTMDNECSSCQFWEPSVREGICTQKIKTIEGKLDNQISKEHYGCNIWERKDN